jgi:hypothetical protein
MAFHVRTTEHAGPKHRYGGHWGPKAEAKHESSRVRRRIGDRAAIAEGMAEVIECRSLPDVGWEDAEGSYEDWLRWEGICPCDCHLSDGGGQVCWEC